MISDFRYRPHNPSQQLSSDRLTVHNKANTHTHISIIAQQFRETFAVSCRFLVQNNTVWTHFQAIF